MPEPSAPKRFSLIESVNWVNVIALTTDDRVVLVRQYRAGSNSVCLEIPGGMIDGDEEPIAAGARELSEETGYTGGTLELIGDMSPNPAIQTNRLYTVLARGVVLTHALDLDDGEHIEVETATLVEVQNNRMRAAKLLGISVRTLRNKLKQYNSVCAIRPINENQYIERAIFSEDRD